MKSSGLIDFFFDPDAIHSDMAFGKANVIVTLSDKILTPKPSRGSRGGFFIVDGLLLICDLSNRQQGKGEKMGRPQQEIIRKNISYSFDPETILRIKKAAKKRKVPASRYVETVLLERLEQEGKSK